MISKACPITRWTSSGSSRSASAVNPDTSTKSTVTCLRSPSSALLDVRIFSTRCLGVYDCGDAKREAAIADAGATGALQPPQNFAPGSLAKPHAAQVTDSEAPHSEQNRRPAAFGAAQRGQFTERSSTS